MSHTSRDDATSAPLLVANGGTATRAPSPLSLLTRFRIGARIYFGFGALLIMMIGIVLFSDTQMRGLETQFEKYDHLGKETLLSADIRAAVYDLQLKSRSFIQDGSEEAKQQFVGSHDTLRSLIAEAKTEIKKPQYASLISSVEAEMEEYSHGFQDIAKLLEQRNALVYGSLGPLGKSMREALTDISDGAFKFKDFESSSHAGHAQEDLLLARLYVMKFVDSNQESMVDRAKEEFAHLDTSLKQLDGSLENIGRRRLLAEVLESFPKYQATFLQLVDIIHERNRIRDEILDRDAKQMIVHVQQIETAIKKDEAALRDETLAGLEGAEHLLELVGLLAVVFGLVAALIIARGITKPLLSLTGSMERLADGDLTVDVPGRDRGDELGQMAGAVDIFKRNGIRTREMEAEQEQQKQKAAQEKRALMMQMAEDFDSHVGGIVKAVSSASTQLNSTAQSMTDLSEQAVTRASEAHSASEQTSSNVQTVASAAEEMTNSIHEISQQVASAANAARDAVGKVASTSAQMDTLAETANKIGEVVEMISTIAEQTNLLALNATIESARAGEAGKGFAVVAGEVKALAGQTAKATDEIAQQIGDIQAASRHASDSMEAVSRSIEQVDEISTAIAAAMEEQNAATQDIAENVNQAAQGTQLVNDNVSAVTDASQKTGCASGEVMNAANALAEQSQQLQVEVNNFIDQVRAS